MKMMKRLLYLAPLLLVGCVFYDRPIGWIPARDPLTPERIVEMKRAGRSDSEIRRVLDFHGLAYKVNADDLIAIKAAGAGDALLTAVATAPVKKPEEAKPIYEQSRHSHADPGFWAVPLGFAVGVGFGYAWGPYWGHCHW